MILAFAFTALAGVATVIGGLLAVHHRVRSDTGLAAALGFAAGAMLLVSVVEIAPKGADGLAGSLGGGGAWVATALLLGLGWAATRVLARRLVARAGGPGRPGGDGRGEGELNLQRIRSSGVLVALAIAAHNLPEGLATFVATIDDPAAGAAIALAIAIHNVPEGIAVAAPLYGAGIGRAKAIGAATLSGVAEPVGAVLGYLLVVALLPPAAYAAVFGFVAGVMLNIAIVELLPSARRLVPAAAVARSFLAGAGTMLLSLVLLSVA